MFLSKNYLATINYSSSEPRAHNLAGCSLARRPLCCTDYMICKAIFSKFSINFKRTLKYFSNFSQMPDHLFSPILIIFGQVVHYTKTNYMYFGDFFLKQSVCPESKFWFFNYWYNSRMDKDFLKLEKWQIKCKNI